MHADKRKKKNYANLRSPLLARLFAKNPLPAVLCHWLFQSLLYMGSTERLFKLGLDLLTTGLIFLALQPFLSWGLALGLAFLAAHTLNFLFNGQLWGILKFYGYVANTQKEFTHYIAGIADRAKKVPEIRQILIYGGLARCQWSPASDLDGRILRSPGLLAGLKVSWFLLLERSRALFAKFPLDFYLVDHPGSLKKLRGDEKPWDLLTIADSIPGSPGKVIDS